MRVWSGPTIGEYYMKILLKGAVVALAMGASAAADTMDFDFDEVGTTVLLSWEGSFDLTGLTIDRSFTDQNSASFINPSAAAFVVNFGSPNFAHVYKSAGDSFSSFGTGGQVSGSRSVFSMTSLFQFSDDELLLTSSYTSGSTISGALSFGGSFASLGIDNTPQSFAFGDNTVNYNFNGETAAAAAVPVPAALPLLLSAFAGLAFIARRRRT